MPHIDLYAIYQLDRRQPHEQLAAQLTTQLNAADPRDTLTRNRIDTARAILGDPARRARYDTALSDPAAPTLDEPALAAIAGRPAPATARPAPASAFAGKQVRILSAITAALAVILIVGITAVACSGGDDSTPTAAATQSEAPRSGGGPASSTECELQPSSGALVARWRSSRPTNVIKLTQSFDIPAEIATTLRNGDPRIAAGTTTNYLRQFQDKTIGVVVFGEDSATMATYRPDGTLIGTRVYSQLPQAFDLSREPFSGYARIQAAGVEIPAEAAGTEPNQQFALTVMPDAFDPHAGNVWVLLRGGTKLYKGTVYRNFGDGDC